MHDLSTYVESRNKLTRAIASQRMQRATELEMTKKLEIHDVRQSW